MAETKKHTVFVIYSGDDVCRVAPTQEEADEIAQRLSKTKSDVHIKKDEFVYRRELGDEQG